MVSSRFNLEYQAVSAKLHGHFAGAAVSPIGDGHGVAVIIAEWGNWWRRRRRGARSRIRAIVKNE